MSQLPKGKADLNKLYKLPYTQQMQFHEGNLRGTYLSISCDAERLLDDLLILCQLEKVFPNGHSELQADEIEQAILKYKRQKIQWQEMGAKLDLCEKFLEKYNEAHYRDFIPHFAAIKGLVNDRNFMAHGYSTYPDVQPEGKIFIDFDNSEKGKWYKKTIEVYPYIMQLEKYRNCVMELMGFTVTLRIEIFGKRFGIL